MDWYKINHRAVRAAGQVPGRIDSQRAWVRGDERVEVRVCVCAGAGGRSCYTCLPNLSKA